MTTDFRNPQENTMTVAHTDPQLTDQQRQTADLARGDADLVLEIAEIAEEQLDETEGERTLRLRYEEALRSLRWDFGAPLSEHVISADKVLRTPKGDMDDERVCEFISRVLDGQSAAEARHAMHRNAKAARISEARSGVASRLHRMADSQWGQQRHEASPVHRNELPPAVPAESAPKPEPLPKRTPQPTPAEPMFPKAPPERPAEQTGTLISIVQDAAASGDLSDSAVRRMQQAGFGQQPQSGSPAMTPPHDPQFGAASIPGQRAVRSGDTVRMAPVPVDVDHMDKVLAELEGESETVEPRPFVHAAVEPSRDTAGSGSGDGDEG